MEVEEPEILEENSLVDEEYEQTVLLVYSRMNNTRIKHINPE
jgi:hypothetical protein